jgi:hypothetical protein
MRQRRFGGMVAAAFVAATLVRPAWSEDLSDKIQRMEQELEEMKRELQAQKEAQQKAQAEQQEKEKQAQEKERQAKGAAAESGAGISYKDLLERVKVGGYGSMRFEASDLENQKNSFVFRRFVLTTDANIAQRLRAYFEVEFERFRKLEVEKTVQPGDEGLTAEQAIETTNNSEISLEQAWLQYDIQSWLNLRAGGVLVPLGRYNINHDDNRWDLPRRTLVDRGVPVLPSTVAWDEVGIGFLGDVALTDEALMSYQIYVMNGVSLDSEFESVIEPGTPKTVVSEVQLSPSTGGFASDVKDSKAVAGRVAFSPALGSEVAGSWYYGQYTPDFLGDQYLWSLGLDGRSGYGPFEIEAEGIFTRFDGTKNVAVQLAEAARDQSSVSSDPSLENEVEFELAQLARNKYGYWIEMRYRFWPAFLTNTFLGRSFANPQLIGVFRAEQAWLDDLVQEIDFSNGVLTAFDTTNRRIDRFTVGLAYRPVPLVVFQLAYEYTQTNAGQSLAGVTNFIPAGPGEDNVNTVMIGTAFGF